MGTMLVTYKVMPISPEVNLEELQKKIKEILEQEKGEKVRFTQEPIAFGLIAIKAGFDLDEKLSLDQIQEKIQNLEEVSSIEVDDMRRAFG
jgi:elongation factor 1-beta